MTQKKMRITVKNKFIFVTLALAIHALLFTSCQTSEKKQTTDQPPLGYTPTAAKRIELPGSNKWVDVSADERFLLFISRDRSKHQGDQIYTYDKSTQKEKRITYQDGDLTTVQYGEGLDWMYFASTTDEIKENPPFIRETLAKRAGMDIPTNSQKDFLGQPLPDTEIYRMKIDGSQIDRITRSQNFDGQLAFSSVTEDLFFTSVRTGKPQIFRRKKNSNKEEKYSHADNHEQYPSLSQDGSHIVYVRKNEVGMYEIIMGKVNARNWTKVLEGPQPVIDPRFTVDNTEIVFLRAKNANNDIEIYSVNVDGSCPRRLTYNDKNEFALRLSPKGDKIYYSAKEKDKFSIYEMKYAPPPCPQPTSSVD